MWRQVFVPDHLGAPLQNAKGNRDDILFSGLHPWPNGAQHCIQAFQVKAKEFGSGLGGFRLDTGQRALYHLIRAADRYAERLTDLGVGSTGKAKL